MTWFFDGISYAPIDLFMKTKCLLTHITALFNMKEKTMNRKEFMFKWFLVGLLSMQLFPVFLKAQNYDTTKTDTSKTGTTNTDTTGYSSIKDEVNNAYAFNGSIDNNIYFQYDSTKYDKKADTSKTDTSKTDTTGYNGSSRDIYAFNRSYPQDKDSTMIDTSKTDTTNTDTSGSGYSRINPASNNTYAFNGNINSSYFKYDSTEIDTSKTDTTKTDTMGYSGSRSNWYAFNTSYPQNEDTTMVDTSKTDTTKTDTTGYNNSENKAYVFTGKKSLHVLVNPVKDLTQKLKEDIYLVDEQTPKIKEILREYEALTYQSPLNSKEIKEAAYAAQKSIENVLMERQKIEWQNAKTEWWASVDKELNLSYLNK